MSGELVTSGVAQVVEVTKSALTLFGEWPLNIMIIGGMVGMGIALVRGFIPKKRTR